MGYHPRIESSEIPSLCTTRSRNSELWLINNSELEDAMLGYTAKYCKRYKVKLYAVATEGNHLHSLNQYPEANRAAFQRDLNSSIARAIPRYVATYHGGRFWARRYSNEFVPGEEDIEEYFFYVVLQAVQDGLVDRISDYPGYNCFSDAVNGVARKYKVVMWGEYNSAKRWNPEVKVSDFTDVVELKYERLPGYEHLTQAEYSKLMHEKLEQRRIAIIAKRDKPAVGAEKLKRKTPGSRPKRTKMSHRLSHRPRILSVCDERRAYYLEWYFDIYYRFKEASEAYRKGNLTVEFPPGTYRPPLFTCRAEAV